MHLLILTQYYPPEIGAPQRRLSELADHFVRRGHRVTVLTAMPSYPEGRVKEGYGGAYRTEVSAGIRITRTFAYPTQRPQMIPRLASYGSFVVSSAVAGTFAVGRPNYLMVESPPLMLGMTAMYLSRLKRTRLIFNVSDLWPESAARLGVISREGPAFRAAAHLEAACYRRAWLVTGQSKEILADISERFPQCETFHLSNGADTTVFGPQCRSASEAARLSGGAACSVLYGGLHGIAQGLDQLLDAAAVLRDEVPTVRFSLVGDGPLKQELVSRARKDALRNVAFLDPVPAASMPALVASADIVVVTLRAYIPGAVPSKIYEAMASGRPVVLVAEGEASEIVSQNQAGLVVRPGDVQSLVEAVRCLRDDPGLRERMGHNGRVAAENLYDRATMASRFIARLEAGVTP